MKDEHFINSYETQSSTIIDRTMENTGTEQQL
jgi:hypothetical protein